MKTYKIPHLKKATLLATMLLTSGLFCHAAVIAPGDVSGLTLFLDSQTGITTDGSGNVSQWNDQAVHGPYHAVQSNADRRPTYSGAGGGGGSPTLLFDGIGGSDATQGSYLRADGAQASVTNSLTMFVVFSLHSNSTSMALVDAGNVNSNLRGFGLYSHSTSGLTVTFKDPGYTNETGTPGNNMTTHPTSISKDNIALNQFTVAAVRIESDGSVYLRAGDISTTTNRSLALTNISGYNDWLAIGSNTPGSWRLDGAISSVALYNRALSNEEIDGIYNFMYETYAIPEPHTAILLLGVAISSLTFRRKRC